MTREDTGMNTTKFLIGLAVAGWLLSGPAARAAEKIGYINMARVFESTSEGKKILKRLQGEHTAKQKELDKRMKEFEERAKQFQQQAALLKDEIKQERLQKLAKEEQELKMLFMQYQTAINKKKADALGKFEERVMGVIQTVAKREGLSYVVRQEVLLHGPTQMDLTNQVIREYDKRHPGKSKKKKGK
jgi:outer membrane protein